VVLWHHLSRAGVAGMIDLDEDPRRRRKGHRRRRGSGDQRRHKPAHECWKNAFGIGVTDGGRSGGDEEKSRRASRGRCAGL
jgi:hypothetical protein